MIAKAYFVLGAQYVRYDAASDSVDSGYPKPIAGNWLGCAEIGFQDGLDAAAEWPAEKVYFFKGNQYARYDIRANRIDAGYPLLIGDQWAGFSAAGFDGGVDAAVHWGNGKAYFFKGNRYLRYDIAADRVDDGFPQSVADGWSGFHDAGFDSGVNAAVNWGDGKAYFFKDDKYLRYDLAADKIDDGYPSAIAEGWPSLARAGFGANLAAAWSRITDPSAASNFDYLADRFFADTKAVCGRLSCAPEDLLGVMESESGIQPWSQNSQGKATGLIQFMPATLKGLGWADGPDDFAKLDADDQLPFVEKYFAPYAGQGLGSAGRLYQATFLPATLPGSDESTVIAAPGGPNADAYNSNKVLDTNHDGQITVGDLTARIDQVRRGPRWDALMRRLAAAG